MVYVIGAGPGAKDYLPPVAVKKARLADMLVGSPGALALFEELDKPTLRLEGNLGECVDYVARNHDGRVIAVLVTGDPGMYSLLGRLSRAIGRDNIEVVPGISSVQVLCARLGMSWEDVRFVSFHGRPVDQIEVKRDLKNSAKVCLLVDSDSFPRLIDCLPRDGYRITVAECLTHDDEKIWSATKDELAGYKPDSRTLLFLERERESEG